MTVNVLPTDFLTLAALLTVAGVAAGAAFTTVVVSLIKNVFPVVDAKVSGALMAFVFTLMLYILAGVSAGAGTLDAWFAVFVAWITCATTAVGAHSTFKHATSPS